ncbi:MAG: toxin-antitoxin system YwqK family antitoxin [Chitinophagia bacterium]
MESSITIPNLYINILDTQVQFHQDTLYFQAKKFSGFIFKLFPNKDTAFVGSYWNGLEEGIHQKWYPHYKLAEFRNYHLGKKEGKHIGFWENGNPKFEYHFSEGELQGITNEWYENGRPYKVMHYQKGYEAGSQKMWWENGVIRANYVVKQGRRYGLIGLKLCMTPKDSIDFKIN